MLVADKTNPTRDEMNLVKIQLDNARSNINYRDTQYS